MTKKVPTVIEVRVLYKVNDGIIQFDTESMETEFDEKVNDLKNEFCEKNI